MHEDTVGGMEHLANHCLVNALHSLGVPVEASSPGPHWAVADGNAMLRPFAMRLYHVPTTTILSGKYVLWYPPSNSGITYGHFTGVCITLDKVVVYDGESMTVHSGMSHVLTRDGMVMYKLVALGDSKPSVNSLSENQLTIIARNREAAFPT